MKENVYDIDIRGVDNKLFCKCRRQDDTIILVSGGGHMIDFAQLQWKVLNYALKNNLVGPS